MKHLIRHTIRFILIPILILLSLICWILFTETGSRLFIQKVFQANDITVDETSITGTLAKHIEMSGLAYHIDEHSKVSIDALALDWTLQELISGVIQVNDLSLNHVTYQINGSSDEKDEPGSLAFEWPAFVPEVHINSFSVDAFTFDNNGQKTAIENLQSSLHTRADEAVLSLDNMQLDTHQVSGDIKLQNNDGINTDIALHWQGAMNETSGIADLKLSGPLDAVAIELSADAMVQLKASGVLDLLANEPELQLQGEVSGDLLQQQDSNVYLQTPVTFVLNGDTEFIDLELTGMARIQQQYDLAYSLDNHLQLPVKDSDVISLHTNWKTESSNTDISWLNIEGEGDIDYVDDKVTIELELAQPFNSTIDGLVNISDKQHTLKIDWDAFHLPLNDKQKLLVNNGHIHSEGTIAKTALYLNSRFAVADISTSETNTTETQYHEIDAEGWLDLSTSIPAGNLSSRIKLIVPESFNQYVRKLEPIELDITSDAKQLQLNAKTRSEINQENYAIDVNAEYAFESNPDEANIRSNWSVINTGSQANHQGILKALFTDNQLVVNTLETDLLGGSASITGNIKLENSSGRFDLSTTDLDIARIVPALESRIDLDGNVTFEQVDNNMLANIQLNSLAGQWRNQILAGNGQATIAGSDISLDQFRLQIGKNDVDITLHMNEGIQGTAKLNLPDLSSIVPEADGVITGDIIIEGSQTSPIIKGTVRGQHIEYGDVLLDSMKIQSDINLAQQTASTFTAELNAVRFSDYALDTLTVSGNGTRESHQLQFDASGKELKVHTKLLASLDENRWQGQLSETDIEEVHMGQWTLREASPFTYTIKDQQLNINTTCLQQEKAFVCMSLAKDKQSTLSGDINMQGLPLEIANIWLPDTVALHGELDGRLDARFADKDWSLTGDIAGKQTRIDIGLNEDKETLNLQTATAKLSLNQDDSVVQLNTASSNYFDINADIHWATKHPDSPYGQARLLIDDISWLQKIDPGFSGSKGQFISRLEIINKESVSSLDASFSLEQGVMFYLPIGLELNAIEGSVSSSNITDAYTITSRLSNKEKQLQLSGDVKLLADSHVDYSLAVTGTDFPIIRKADLALDISPDLKLSGNAEQHKLRGKLTVPYMDLFVNSIPEGAISTSDDTVIVRTDNSGKLRSENAKKSAFKTFMQDHLDMDINVEIGPDIHLSGFGLNTGISGNLQVIKPIGVNLPLGKGQLNIINGTYRAYSQNLVIDQGQILFAGPIDNPGLSVRAYRPNLPVTAGIQVIGNIRRPRITLYSNPSMTQAETLTYLVTGRPLNNVSGGEANLVAQAALSLGYNQSSVLTSQIEDAFNLDEFSVSGGDTLSSTSLTAGKKITPKLTARSSFNPFEQLWSFFMNYEITENWSVQTESGVTQGADVIYSIDTDTLSEVYKKLFGFMGKKSDP